MQGMTPEQRTQFLQNHPHLQQFINTHPGVAKHLASGGPIHDAASPRFNEVKVNQRLQNEQQRIAQGVSSGSLTSAQTSKLENGVQEIKQEETKDLKNDGRLSQSEVRDLQHDENQLSHEIRKEKHQGKGK